MDTFEVKEIVAIFGVATAMLFIASRIRLPSIVAFLLTGMLVGPFGLRWVESDHIEHLATFGIILLLFSIGLEFSIRRLLAMKRLLFIGGSIQLASTVFIGWLVAWLIGRPTGEALFLGFLLALSSTAIVMKCLSERHETDSPHGRFSLALMIFQDIVTIPLLLAVPLFAGLHGLEGEESLLVALGKGVLIIGAVYFLANNVVPHLMFHVTKTKRREFFLLTVLTICFTVALVTHLAGLPISLGAFLAGLTVSESEYRHRALGDVLPFQETFSSFFFVSVGMLLNIDFVMEHPWLITFVTLGVLLMKTGTGILSALVMRYPLRSAVLAGLFIAQVGEFSFVLAAAGRNYQLGTEFLYQLFLAVSLFTMALSPYLIHFSGKIATFLQRMPLPARFTFGFPLEEQKRDRQADVLIIGFGVCGRGLARACKSEKIPYSILEMNPQVVHEEREHGEPIFFGDATHESVLHHVGIMEAKAVVIAINDPNAAKRSIEVIRGSNPAIFIVARTRYVQDISFLHQQGADEVIADEFESAIEVLVRVLKRCRVGADEITKTVSDARLKGHQWMWPHV